MFWGHFFLSLWPSVNKCEGCFFFSISYLFVKVTCSSGVDCFAGVKLCLYYH